MGLGDFIGSLGGLGALGEMAGGIFGGSGDAKRQRQILEQALAELKGTNAEAGGSAYTSDPEMLAALAAMRKGYEQGGMTQADKLAQQQAMQESARAERGREGALMQNMAARGMGGGGAELAARLANQQQATDAQWGAGAHQAGLAQQRALESLRGWSGLASQRAGARDAIAQFNASQRLNKAGMVAGQANKNASYYGSEAERKRKQGAAIGGMAGSGLAGLTGLPG